jgi:hypothetical protein
MAFAQCSHIITCGAVDESVRILGRSSREVPDAEKSPVQRIMEIRQEIKTLPGQRVHNALKALDRPVRFLLIPNGNELDQHLSAFHEGAEGVFLLDPQNEELMMAYLGEALRRTHNLVASVATIVDQTRRVLEKGWPDGSHPIRTDFETAKMVFGVDGRLLVVRGLRNYFLHRSLPEMIAQERWDRQAGMSNRVLLATRSLLEWDGWRPPAREHLRAAGESIELRPLTAHYLNEAVVLAPWEALADEHDEYVGKFREQARRIDTPTQTTARRSEPEEPEQSE